uniref:Heat shock protein 70 n=1 Tax=Panagrolaimus sp. ES5 TaxID=591445 RepID=A0AC34GTC3_9BILA
MRVDPVEALPYKKAFKFERTNDVNILEAVFSQKDKECISLPNFEKVLLVLSIDVNSIYSIQYANVTDVGDCELAKLNLKSPITISITDIYTFPNKNLIKDSVEINAVGIDLGTTRCCAAVNRKNGINTVALDNKGERLLPSYVAFDEKHEKCGQIVIDRLRNYAKSSIFDVKRIIGKRFNDVKIDNSWPFTVNELITLEPKTKYCVEDEREENLLIKFISSTGLTLKYPEEISAVLLKHIKEKVEEFQGKKLTEAVITVPAAFNENQNQATLEAAYIAGWKTIHLLPEPVAAAFAYFINRPIPNNSTLLLFDLGGGTLDVCIFKIQNNQLQIISKTGDSNTGGRDFDNLLIKYFEKKLNKYYKIELDQSKKYKLMIKCQNIKENLSILQEDLLDAEEIDSLCEENISITRNQFEAMSEEILCRIRFVTEVALEKIDYEPNQIDKILLVGGSCRMPMIPNLLKEIFPYSDHICEEHPDEVVAVGAAYYSYYLNQKDKNNCSIM